MFLSSQSLRGLICPSVFEFMMTEVVPSSSHYQNGERVKLMSHGGTEEMRRKKRVEGKRERESALVRRRRASL